jgi:hypothetical protein
MTHMSPFDHRPDPELGGALKEVLRAEDDAAFARRVLAAAEPVLGGERGEWWEVLVRWVRPELAAAALALLAGAALWLGVLSSDGNAQAMLGDPLRGAVEDRLPVPALLAESPELSMDEVLAVAMGN